MPHVPADTDPRRLTRGKPPELGVFGGPVGMAVQADGGPLGPVEHAAAMKARKFQVCLLNAFDGVTDEWDWPVWVGELERVGIPWGWWARCYTPTDLRKLIRLTAEYGRTICVVNCEKELDVGAVTVDDLLGETEDLRGEGVEFGLSTESPLYHSVAWERLDAFVVMPQAFGNEFPSKTAGGAYTEAKVRASRVNVTVGVYPVDGRARMSIADYGPLPKAWSVYPVDSVEEW